MKLTDSEQATILAALRNLQNDMRHNGHATNRALQRNWMMEAFPEHFDASGVAEALTPPDSDGIDALCEKLNCATAIEVA